MNTKVHEYIDDNLSVLCHEYQIVQRTGFVSVETPHIESLLALMRDQLPKADRLILHLELGNAAINHIFKASIK